MSKIYGNMIGGACLAQTYILQDSEGNEITATYVDSDTIFDATANDIREGKTAATDTGVTVGTKDIPAYHTTEGIQLIPAGNELCIHMSEKEKAMYTKLQALVCDFNISLDNSVSTSMVCIEDKVYNVSSTDELSSITIDADNGHIKLGITNNSDKQYLIRYFTYKEEN